MSNNEWARAIETLQEAGIANPLRLAGLIRKTVEAFELDLAGLCIVTEAASGAYVGTPVIAALAGARRIIALTRESKYASAEHVRLQTRALETLCQTDREIEIFEQGSAVLFEQADIVTNSGFVRPIDRAKIAAMKSTAVVTLMYEPWEFRPEDVDLEACRARGVLVAGTNEDHPCVNVFNYCGVLAQKMLLDAQIEIHKSTIAIVSADKFGTVIRAALTANGAKTRLIQRLDTTLDLAEVDAIILADYTREDEIIGATGDISAGELAAIAPSVTIIQFAGRADVSALRALGLSVFPGIALNSHRMAMTLSALGPRPVVELHTAGFKVGQLAAGLHRDGSGDARSNLIEYRGQPLGQII